MLLQLVLFASVGSLGTTNGWDMPAGLSWGSTGRQMSFSDVAITSWMWIVQCCLFTLMMFVPPAFNQSPRWLYVQLSMACQSTLFGLSCITAMLCTPSVLTLGIPLAYLAQVCRSLPHICTWTQKYVTMCILTRISIVHKYLCQL